MWWIISLILIVPLVVEAVATTFVVMVMLNGYSRVPDAMVGLYLTSAVSLIPSLSLVAGLLAKTVSALYPLPLWLSGSLTGLVALVLFPVLLVTLTFLLLAVFGML